MKEDCQKINNYNVHFVKTNKFDSTYVAFFFISEVSKKKITYNNFLDEILFRATKNYQTKRLLSLKLYELYSPYLFGSTYRLGNLLVNRIGFSYLNSSFIKESLGLKTLEFFHEVLFNPCVTNNHFQEEIFNIVQKELINDTKKIVDDNRLYAFNKLLSIVDDNANYTLSEQCDLDILKNITKESLYSFYKDMLKNSQIEIVIVGNVNQKEYLSYLKKYYVFPSKGLDWNGKSIISHTKMRDNIQEIIEEKDILQSKLCIALKIKKMNKKQFNYVGNIFNEILGGNFNSLLMTKIREENSMCYYIDSFISKIDGMLYIEAGVNYKNYEKVISLIKKCLHILENGEFSDTLLNSAINSHIGVLDNAKETVGGYFDLTIGQILLNTKDIKTRKRNIKKITKKDIMEFSKLISIDTIYFLNGGYNAKE